ncbi:hypothetical protein ACFL2B_03340, partial [Patescibacteria group bacterium]
VAIPFGPPLEKRVSKEDAIKVASEAGLHVESDFEAGSYHYGLILKKSASEKPPEKEIQYE